jgi:hypothetical protein
MINLFFLENVKCLKEFKKNLIVLKDRLKVARKFYKNSNFEN